MRQWIRPHFTYANVMVTILAFIVLGGGTALASYVITSNSQVGPGTISGHQPPSGDHANIISGSVNATDLANRAVRPAKIGLPEAWHAVGPGSTTTNLCADPSNTAVFCSLNGLSGPSPWHNYGSGYATAGFYKDQLGIVHLKGLVAASFINELTIPVTREIFRLPSAYRPANQRIFPSVGDNVDGQSIAQARVDIQPDGLVILTQDCAPNYVDCSASGGYLTLDGISFRRDG
jgi:hypothetical protein